MSHRIGNRLLTGLLLLFVGISVAHSQPPSAPATKRKARSKENTQQRDKSLRAIAGHLQIGAGAVIADIGAGNGPDTRVFAGIVGESGKVIAEEIDAAKVKALREDVSKRKLSQVEVVLGKPDNPSLPAGAVDMAFMHFVYHHVTRPTEMLQGIWRSLKPGGYLVIVDQRRGTLADWVPREDRGKTHYWIAETTVVREAREQGFAFVEAAESLWHVQESFVLIFQRPRELAEPGRDPDPLPAIPETVLNQLVPAQGRPSKRIAFVALGAGRKLMPPILDAAACPAVDIVLEEWATRKDERPPLPAGLQLPAVLTEKGSLPVDPEPLDAVYFLDTYHLLFHAPTLLAQLHERLSSTGRIHVLDRQAAQEISHREASHRRMISLATVKQEMATAGYRVLHEEFLPASGRFLAVFEKAAPE